MEHLSSSPSPSASIFDHLHSLNNNDLLKIPNYICPTQLLEAQANEITPAQLEEVDNLLIQIPPFIENDDDHHDFIKTNNYQGKRRINGIGINPNEKNKKQKMVHREIERQRRLEMSSLHASLRSLLPLEYVKGKRAMSDHLGEAVKYIRHLQEKIQVLSEKKDSLEIQVSDSKTDDDRHHDVCVNLCKGGLLEVIVCTTCGSDENKGLPLSKVIQCLIKQRLDVVSCISNQVNNNLVHSIQAQVGDGRNNAVDPVELQQKLADINI